MLTYLGKKDDYHWYKCECGREFRVFEKFGYDTFNKVCKLCNLKDKGVFVDGLVEAIEDGESYNDIRHEFGIARSTLYNIRNEYFPHLINRRIKNHYDIDYSRYPKCIVKINKIYSNKNRNQICDIECRCSNKETLPLYRIKKGYPCSKCCEFDAVGKYKLKFYLQIDNDNYILRFKINNKNNKFYHKRRNNTYNLVLMLKEFRVLQNGIGVKHDEIIFYSDKENIYNLIKKVKEILVKYNYSVD